MGVCEGAMLIVVYKGESAVFGIWIRALFRVKEVRSAVDKKSIVVGHKGLFITL